MRGCAISVLLPMRRCATASYGRAHEQQEVLMRTSEATVLDDATAQELSERLADVFRTADVGDVLADSIFLDGHPPLWRFQLEGRDVVATWLKSYSPDGAEVTVVRTIPTVTGFVTEFVGRHEENGEEMTDRKILLAEVRGGRIAELTVYCNGDWNAELRARHAVETDLIRP
jgi:ketosteroid isomerase-like protein